MRTNIIPLSFSSTAKLIVMGALITCNMANAQLKLYNNGNLSIGSIIPPPTGIELQVVGNTVFSQNTGVITSAAYVKGLNFYSGDTNPDYTWMGDTKTGIYHPSLGTLAVSVSGRPEMIFSPGNNIMIDSTVDIGDKLQVNASMNQNPFDIFSNTNTNNKYSGINWVNNATTKAWAVKNGAQDEFYVYGNGQAYSYGWNTISDSTLKENVFPISNALNKVLRLNGVTYNLKAGNAVVSISGEPVIINQPRQMGLIAQAVERVVPEVVTENSNGIKTIAYSNMVGLLVEAIKQEDMKVDGLQHELDSIKRDGLNNSSNNKNDIEKHRGKEAILYPCASCPTGNELTVQCYIPEQSKEAKLMFFDMSGGLKKTISIEGKETQSVNVNKGEFTAGMYYYSLVVDGNEVDTKKIILSQN